MCTADNIFLDAASTIAKNKRGESHWKKSQETNSDKQNDKRIDSGVVETIFLNLGINLM